MKQIKLTNKKLQRLLQILSDSNNTKAFTKERTISFIDNSLKDICYKEGITITKKLKDIGVSRSTYYHFKHGKEPSYIIFFKLVIAIIV